MSDAERSRKGPRSPRPPDRASADPRFSVDLMDRSVEPSVDFYRYAAGGWIQRHPVPADKSRWGAFAELSERNYANLHEILDRCARGRTGRGATKQVGTLFRAAMDTATLEKRRYGPVVGDLRRIGRIRSLEDFAEALGRFHDESIGALFGTFVSPDRKESGRYAFYLVQGGLSLPDRDYYLGPEFEAIRSSYRTHVATSLSMLGDARESSERAGTTVLSVETELARAGRSRTELRDAVKNYNPSTRASFLAAHAGFPWRTYFAARGIGRLPKLVVGQPEFFERLDALVAERPLEEWRTYLRWHLLTECAPYLHEAAERENFEFFHRTLLGQAEPEPRWKRSARVVDMALGEALGRLYVERHFPPEAGARMRRLVDDLRAVFRSRLERLSWMTPGTRKRALAKFDRFTMKIGHPDVFRTYGRIRLDPRDYVGDVRRAARFEVRRQMERIGHPVDRSEWHMTPPLVNAYFNATQNEIVFPAGILQPPFFDLAMDDAVNYGAIGAVIGHEITHGYDDQGRKFDADGNLSDWWSTADAQEFERRAQKIVEEYNAFEPLPGTHVNGALTMGENIADVGGLSIAFEALQRRLDADPDQRRTIDGLTPEQRFFVSFAQVWRENAKEEDLKRRLTIDPHSPGRYRAIGATTNLSEFYAAFGIRPGSPMWRPEDARVAIW